MMFQVTVRYGSRYQRYHTYRVDAGDLPEALRSAAEAMPGEIVEQADLVEIRPAPDPEARSYMGDEGEGGSNPEPGGEG